MKQKKVLSETIGHSHGFEELDGPIDQIIQKLTTLMSESINNGYSNIRIVWTSGYSSDDIEWLLQGDRLETDGEYARRINIEKKLLEQKKKDRIDKRQKELREYERLKKKFEKDN